MEGGNIGGRQGDRVMGMLPFGGLAFTGACQSVNEHGITPKKFFENSFQPQHLSPHFLKTDFSTVFRLVFAFKVQK
ncbi:hypothetical protein [Mangrovibacterium marinum]|uniref:hypothetical protein n=1 Tax=Mangrovibacterium marinum TaxID=1639118 RepID=UPI000D3203F1|nr:hypothetical protein [Mangrovibacterium marinum]